mmetsp:Transcript_95427/g.169419  ORF Transcript_95427/g.169419 Transcript_95427/m.169419 type:complete len:82 (-) Transcript_95427:737-982(-)
MLCVELRALQTRAKNTCYTAATHTPLRSSEPQPATMRRPRRHMSQHCDTQKERKRERQNATEQAGARELCMCGVCVRRARV